MENRFEQNPNSQPPDNVSLVARGAAVAAFTIGGLNFPTVYNTLKKNFPTGLMSILSGKFKTGVNPYELVYVMQKEVYGKYKDPEAYLKYIVERNNKDKIGDQAAAEQVEVDRNIRDAIISDKERKKLEEINAQSIWDSTSVIDKQKHISNLEEELTSKGGRVTLTSGTKEELLYNARLTAIQEFLLTTDFKTLPTIIKPYAQEAIQNPKCIPSEIAKSIVEQLQIERPEFMRQYMTSLSSWKMQGVHMDFGTGRVEHGLFALNKFKQVPKSKARVLPFGPTPDDLGIVRDYKYETVHDPAGRIIRNMGDEFMTSGTAVHFDKFRTAITGVRNSTVFKKTLSRLQSSIDAYNNGLLHRGLGPSSGVTPMSARVVVRKRDGASFVEITLSGGENLRNGNNRAPVTIEMPLEDKYGHFKSPSGQWRQSNIHLIGGNVGEVGERAYTSTGYVAEQMNAIGKLVQDYTSPSGHNGSLWQNKYVRQLAKASVAMEGSSVRNFFNSAMVNVHSVQAETGKNRKVKEMRGRGNLDWNLYQMQKRSGRDIVVYDTEFYNHIQALKDVGVQPLMSMNPTDNHIWQISYKKYDKNMRGLVNRTIYINDSIRKDQMASFTSQLRTVHTMNDEEINETLQNIKNGISLKDAINLFESETTGALYVDQNGSMIDRRIINGHAGRTVIHDSQAVDTMNMGKALSYQELGYAGETMFHDLLTSDLTKDRHIKEMLNITRSFNSNKGNVRSVFMDRMIDVMSNQTISLKEKKKTMLLYYEQAKHDASADTMIGTYNLYMMTSMHPLLGFSGTAIAEVNKWFMTGYVGWQDKFRAIHKFMLHRHFVGETQAIKSLMSGEFAAQGHTSSIASILSGKVGTYGNLFFNMFTYDDSNMRQVYQMNDGTPTQLLDMSGRRLSPFNVALRHVKGQLTDEAISANLEHFSKQPMFRVFWTAGNATTAGSASLIDAATAANRYALRVKPHFFRFKNLLRPNGIDMSTESLQLEGEAGKIYNLARKRVESRTGGVVNAAELNDEVDRIIAGKNRAIDGIRKRLSTASGSRAERYKGRLASFYSTRQDALIAKVGDEGFRYEDPQFGRVKGMKFITSKEGESAYQVELAFESMSNGLNAVMDKVYTTEGIKMGLEKVHGLNKLYSPVDGHGDAKVNEVLGKIDIVSSFNFLDRNDYGAYKRMQVMRIADGLLAQKGGKKKADAFMRDVFGKTYRGYKGGNFLYEASMGNISEVSEAMNNINLVNLNIWMGKTHKWTSGTVSAHLETVKGHVAYKYDGDAKKTFRLIAEHEAKEAEKGLRTLSTSVEGGIDERMIQTITNSVRGSWNPYFNLAENRETETFTNNPRMWDYRYNTVKQMMERGVTSLTGLLQANSAENSNRPMKNMIARVGAHTIEQQMLVHHGWKNSPIYEGFGAFKGRVHRQARQSLMGMMEHYLSGKVSHGGSVKIISADDLNKTVSSLQFQLRKGLKDQDPFNTFRNISMMDPEEMEISTWMEELSSLEDSLKSGHLPSDMTKTEVEDKIIELKTLVTNRSAIFKDRKFIGGFLTAEQAKGTFLEQINRNAFGEYDKELNLGSTKVAPNDLILLETKPTVSKLFDSIHDPKKFMEMVMSNLPDDVKNNNVLKANAQNTIDLMFAGRTGIVLPSIQATMEAGGAAWIQGGKMMYAQPTVRAMTNILWAVNDLNNMASVDFTAEKLREAKAKANGLQDSIAKFVAMISSKAQGKHGVMDSRQFYFLQGQYGTTMSQQTIGEIAQFNMNAFGPDKESFLSGFSRHARDTGMTQSKRTADIMATREYNKGRQLMEFLSTPGVNVKSRSQFLKSMIGDVTVAQHIKQVNKSLLGEGKQKEAASWAQHWRDILSGKKGIALPGLRWPTDPDTHGAGGLLTYLVDDTSWALRGANIKDKHPFSIFNAIDMGMDFDGDNAFVGNLTYNSIKEMDEREAWVREQNQRRAKAVSEYHRRIMNGETHSEIVESWRVGDDRALSAERYMLSNRAAIMASDFGRTFVEDKNSPLGFVEKVLTHEESRKMGTFKGDLSWKHAMALMRNRTTDQYFKVIADAADTLTLSKMMIGDMTSAVNKWIVQNRKLREVIESPDKIHETVKKRIMEAMGISEKQVKEYADIGSEIFGPEGVIAETLSVAGQLSSKTPQVVISGKRLQGQEVTQKLSKIMSSLMDLRNPDSHRVLAEEIFERRITGGSPLKTSAERDIIKNYTTMVGVVFNGMNAISGEGIIKQQIEIESGYMNHNGTGHAANFAMALNNTAARAYAENPELGVQLVKQWNQNAGYGLLTPGETANREWDKSMFQMMFGKGYSTEDLSDSIAKKFGKIGKSLYEHNVGRLGAVALGGAALATFFSPDALSGGVADLGMNIGDRPGVRGRNKLDLTFSPLSSLGLGEVANDPFTEKWARLVNSNPILADKYDKLAPMDYKEIARDQQRKTIENYQYRSQTSGKRIYFNNLSKFSKHYQTNDMRKIETVGAQI